MSRWRLTGLAERDVAHILRESRDLFGPDQAIRYAALIARTFELVATDPERATSQARPECGQFVRSISVSVAAARRRAASHAVYYRSLIGHDADHLQILRVLHERMDPRRRVMAAASDLTRS